MSIISIGNRHQTISSSLSLGQQLESAYRRTYTHSGSTGNSVEDIANIEGIHELILSPELKTLSAEETNTILQEALYWGHNDVVVALSEIPGFQKISLGGFVDACLRALRGSIDVTTQHYHGGFNHKAISILLLHPQFQTVDGLGEVLNLVTLALADRGVIQEAPEDIQAIVQKIAEAATSHPLFKLVLEESLTDLLSLTFVLKEGKEKTTILQALAPFPNIAEKLRSKVIKSYNDYEHYLFKENLTKFLAKLSSEDRIKADIRDIKI